MRERSKRKQPDVILIALGANLPSVAGQPLETCLAALDEFAVRDISVDAVSRWYESAPVPASDQPWFVNGVASVQTGYSPQALLNILHSIERVFGRARASRNAPRTLDLDLLAYHDQVADGPPVLPHPRLQDRAFVLSPLRDIAPDWRHPVTGMSVETMISALEEPNQPFRSPDG
jgi:2-amino-4-hydroxy-6-hydroxymethyldihydropteridine diphosphokinase